MTYQAASCSEKHQRQLILADGKNSAQDERNAIGMLLALRCEAIIVYPKFLSAEALETLIEQHETPIIVINHQLPHHQNHAVYIEHYHSSQLMTQYLLDQGHTRIAFIAGQPGSPSGEQRLAGFLDTPKAAGIAHDEALRLEGDWTPESGYRAAQTLLARVMWTPPACWRPMTIWRLARRRYFWMPECGCRRICRWRGSMTC